MSDRRRDPQPPARQEPEGNPVLQRASEILDEIDRSAALLGEILAEAAPDRSRLVEEQPRFRALMLCDLLFEKSRAAGFSDPAAALELAELAVLVSGRLDAGHYGERLVEDARARAWGHLANALRISSDLGRAEEALGTAEEHHRRAGEDAYTGAEILSFKASLLNAQGRYDEAAALLDPVANVYREARDAHREGRTLIQKAAAVSYAGRHAEAIRLARRGLAKIDLFEEPRLLVSARHSLIGYLNELGQHEEALKALSETRGLYFQLGERSPLVRLRWLEGKILRDLGRLDEAETALREVKTELVELRLGLDAALASLDLAMVFLARGEAGELKRLAVEMIAVFESREDHRHALAAFLLFQKAAEAEQVTLALLQEVASSLEQAQRSTER
ncbi:MAG: tetratricopeptide repeat protein [Acidobacteriota bacterium]